MYTFMIQNAGTQPHNITLDGPGLHDKASPTLSPGGSGKLTVMLQKGTYDAYCSVDSHQEKGMNVSLHVS